MLKEQQYRPSIQKWEQLCTIQITTKGGSVSGTQKGSGEKMFEDDFRTPLQTRYGREYLVSYSKDIVSNVSPIL